MAAVSPASHVQAPQNEPQAPKTAEKPEADNFLALLNIGSVQADESAGPAPAAPAEKPAAAREHAAAPTPEKAPSAPKAASQPTQPREPQPPAREAATQRPQTQQREEAPEKTETRPSQEPAKSQGKPQQAEAPAKQVKSADTPEENSGIAEKQKKIREALNAELDAIAQILQALINALSGQTPPAQDGQVLTAVAATPATAEETNALVAASATIPADTESGLTASGLVKELLQWLTPAQTPAGNASSSQPSNDAAQAEANVQAQLPASGGVKIALPESLASEGPENDLALLKEIQSLLHKLQDSMKAVDNDTPLSAARPGANPADSFQQHLAPAQNAAPVAKLQALVEHIRQDVTALEQRFMPATGEAPAPAEVTGETSGMPAAPAKMPALFSFLKESIGQIRDRLQTLQSDNEGVYAQAKNTLQQQYETAQAKLVDMPVQPQAQRDAVMAATIETGLPAVAETSAAGTNTAAPAPSQAPAPAPVAVTITQALPDQQLGGQTGGQQGQQQGHPQPQAPASISGASATSDASRAQTPGFARMLARGPAQPVAEQVAFHVKTAVSDGTSKIRIQLDPADLGKMDIKLTVDAGGKTGVSIIVDSKATLDLLQRDAQNLARALNDAGLSTDSGSLSFNLRGGQQEGQERQNAQAAQNYRKTQPEEEEAPLLNIANRQYVVNLADGLDIQI